MQVYNTTPIQALTEMVEDLVDDIPIYFEAMTEDDNSIPDSYMLLRSEIADSTQTYGDGVSQIRTSDCDIVLVSKGSNGNYDSLHNTNKNKIINKLKEKGVNYIGSNLGYDDTLESMQYTFSIEVIYCG